MLIYISRLYIACSPWEGLEKQVMESFTSLRGRNPPKNIWRERREPQKEKVCKGNNPLRAGREIRQESRLDNANSNNDVCGNHVGHTGDSCRTGPRPTGETNDC